LLLADLEIISYQSLIQLPEEKNASLDLVACIE